MIDQQLYIDGQLADLGDNTEVTLTHESNILTGAASFKSNHSLTVTIPATSRNRMLFGYADIVQSTTDEAYQWHTAEYTRNGVPIVSKGQCRLLKATHDSMEVAIVWGMKRAIDNILGGDMTIADIETDAAIEFHAQPQVSTYTDALTDEVFYAGMDMTRYMDELEYYHMHVAFENKSWDTNALMGASSYLHPSVRMNWILGKIEDINNVVIDFDDPFGDISTMIVPLISKIPNDITFNWGYMAHASEPTSWGGAAGNFIQLQTTHNSSIINEQTTDPASGVLTCQTAFNGLLRFSIYMYLDNLVSIAYPIFRSRYGYRLDVSVQGRTQSCIIIPENSYFMAQERDSQGRIGFTIGGSLPIKMEVGDRLTMRITCISNGVADVFLSGGIHVNGGNVRINDIIGSLNEVQPTQQYPVEGNLPKIKVVDLIKFLCAVTGAFPVQASTDEVLSLKQIDDVFNWSRAVDWTDMLLSQNGEGIAEEVGYTPDGWAQQNWWRWKEDETVKGEYDGAIAVDDETVELSRDVMTFPFAATDGNNIPLYTSEYKYDSETQTWNTTVKWNKVEPRVLHMDEDINGKAVGVFAGDMAQILSRYYFNLAATMSKPVVIMETVRMTDIQFIKLDETRPIYFAQHGAYFAMLSCELHQNGTAKVKLLKLKKQEEI